MEVVFIAAENAQQYVTTFGSDFGVNVSIVQELGP